MEWKRGDWCFVAVKEGGITIFVIGDPVVFDVDVEGKGLC